MPVQSVPIEGRVLVVHNDQSGPGLQNNLNGSGNQYISLSNCFNTTNPNPLRTLWDAVGAVGGSHNANHQFQRGGCMDGTREEVLRVIFAWIASRKRSLPILWLSGPVGVGKSAIAITVARSLAGKGLVASFFFRSDPKRDNPSALMVSISHGVSLNMPFAKSFINRRISDDPTILEAPMEDQFRELVLKPSLRWRWWRRLLAQLSGDVSASKDPDLVIIDGLDECGDEHTQRRILSIILSSYQQSRRSPLRFMICSRPEAWIQGAFKADGLCQLTECIILDEQFVPDKDIERYYLHEFQLIRAEQKYARVQFPTPWPSPEDLGSLIQKSSGQFVYAVTTVSFIKSAAPLIRLRAILDYAPESQLFNVSFSAGLDNLYHVILSFNPHREQLLSILAAVFILPSYATPSPEFIEFLLELPTGEVDTTLWSLHSVLIIQGGDAAITAYHTSFTDFIFDASRSREFHVDRDAYHHNLVIQWLDVLTRTIREHSNLVLDPNSWTDNVRHLLGGWYGLCLADKQATEELLGQFLKSILSAFPDQKRLLTTLASIILLPAPQSNLTQFQALNDFILGPDEVHASSTMKLLETCQLVVLSDKTELAPFFSAMICADPSQEYYIDIDEQRYILARRWIQALVPSNQPTSKPDWGLRTLWAGWGHFCSGIERIGGSLLSDLQDLDFTAVASVNSSIAVLYDLPLSMVAQSFERIVSWLKSADSSVLSGRFVVAAKPFRREDVDKSGESDPKRRSTKSSIQTLRDRDTLYHAILRASPDYEQLRLAVAAIATLPDVAKSPSCIELILGLPAGDISLVTPYLYSFLDIGGSDDTTPFVFTPLFMEYLADRRRSGYFYINRPAWTYVIARMWLQNLSTQAIRTYSSDRLWDEGNAPFFREWIGFCVSIHMPTRDLLDALCDVDLAAAPAILGRSDWEGFYKELVPWVRLYRESEEPTETGDHGKARKNPRYEGNSYNNGQDDVAAPSRKMDNRRDGPDLVKHLVHRFQNGPQYFHLEWPPSEIPPNDVVYWILDHAIRCPRNTRLDGSRPSPINDVRLTECRCDLSGGKESSDPWHLLYQGACLKLVRVYVSLFEELSETDIKDERTLVELESIFLNLTHLSLLKHCRVDTELLSLCRRFLWSAKHCLAMQIPSDGGRGRKNMIKWFKTFPQEFAASEGEVLKEYVLGLPWEWWDENYWQT